jgi:hypothetical protein
MNTFAVLSGRGVTVELDAEASRDAGIDGTVTLVFIDDATEFVSGISDAMRDKLRDALKMSRLTDDLDATVRELTPRGLRDVIRAATDALMEAAND